MSKITKVAIINYAEGYDANGNLAKGLLIVIDNEEYSFHLSDDLKSTMKQFTKLQSKGYALRFGDKQRSVNPDDFIQVKKEYRD